jgi:integrase
MAATQPIRSKKEVRNILDFYKKRGQVRNYVLVCIGVFTALRISDILRLNCDDLYDFETGSVRESITVREKKTGKLQTIALHEEAKKALEAYFSLAEPGMPLILNKSTGNAIGRIQAYRLIRAAGEVLKLAIRVSCHSLRKTFGYHSWKNGAQPAVLMEIYNHSSWNTTKRYLGVTQDDKNALYLGLSY